MRKVFYWCPFISKVATVRSVVKSAESLKRYSKGKFEPVILNVAGEWDEFKKKYNDKNIEVHNLTNSKILKNRNWTGLISSRLIYIYIFFRCFIPTFFFLKKNESEIIIIHLITSLPLLLNYIFKTKIKVILRISGMPKLNFFRNFMWILTSKNLAAVTSPTIGTYNELKKFSFLNDRLYILYDPVISPSEIINKKKEFIRDDYEYYISIGRLTRQKNFEFLITTLKKADFLNKKFKLLIFGEGELKEKLNKIIINNKMQNMIKIYPFQKNIYNYLYKSKGLILTSLWEDPGFVIIEAAYLNVPILSSNCKNGPEEILNFGENGVLYKNKNEKSFLKQLDFFLNLNKEELKLLKNNAKKNIIRYTIFRHYKQLTNIIEIYER